MPVPQTIASPEVAAFADAVDDFMRAARRARGRLGADGDLSLSQYHLLEPLLDTGRPLGVGELACSADVAPPTAPRMAAALERDGLVERRACDTDRRVVHIALTPAGRARLARQRARIRTRRAELFRSLEPAEREQARRPLDRLAARIDALC